MVIYIINLCDVIFIRPINNKNTQGKLTCIIIIYLDDKDQCSKKLYKSHKLITAILVVHFGL